MPPSGAGPSEEADDGGSDAESDPDHVEKSKPSKPRPPAPHQPWQPPPRPCASDEEEDEEQYARRKAAIVRAWSNNSSNPAAYNPNSSRDWSHNGGFYAGPEHLARVLDDDIFSERAYRRRTYWERAVERAKAKEAGEERLPARSRRTVDDDDDEGYSSDEGDSSLASNSAYGDDEFDEESSDDGPAIIDGDDDSDDEADEAAQREYDAFQDSCLGGAADEAYEAEADDRGGGGESDEELHEDSD